MIQNNGPPPVDMALAAPVPPIPTDVDMLPNEDNHSDLTVTISSAHTSSDESGGSVNGHNQNLHIGMALGPEVHVDPVAVLSASYRPETVHFDSLHVAQNDIFLSKEGTSAWTTHFKPDGSIINTVNIPAQWADFFTAKLLTPEDFEWTKGLLQSKIWQILSEFEVNGEGSARAFVLPRVCPSAESPVCTLTVAREEITQGFMTPQAPRIPFSAASTLSTSALHVKKRGKKTPLVCTEVRRSNRIKALNKGYKAKTCFDKKCLACAAVGPKIKKSVVTNLCSRFQISDEEVEGKEAEVSSDEEEDAPAVPTGSKSKNPAKKGSNASTKKSSRKK
jgi:hypothetical protein